MRGGVMAAQAVLVRLVRVRISAPQLVGEYKSFT
jgi:hypothetical protein